MKRFILLLALSMILVATYSYADKEGHMMDSGMMDSPGYGDAEKSGSESHGMMGYGGCEMMGGGMGPGMMGHHQKMHGSGSSGMMGEVSSEEQQKFLNNTVDLRKQLMMKRFDYHEASRNPDTKPEAFKKIKKDMWEIQKKINDKWYE